MIHFVSVGGNIEPREHLSAALSALRARFGRLHLSRVLETEPHEIDDPRPFLNVAVAFASELPPAELKAWFNQLEEQQGRDRSHPRSSRLARPLDLDIVCSLEPGQPLAAEQVPPEPYVRPFLLDLARHLELPCPLEAPDLPEGVGLEVDGQSVGRAPLTLEAP